MSDGDAPALDHDPWEGFDARLVAARTIEDVKALIAAATVAMRRARGKNDLAAHKIAIGKRMAAQRRAGVLLAGGANALGVDDASVRCWRRLARLTAADFQAAAEAGNEDAGRRPSVSLPHVRMVVTRWCVNALGNQHRRVYADDSDVRG
jgi:hypothetical protein